MNLIVNRRQGLRLLPAALAAAAIAPLRGPAAHAALPAASPMPAPRRYELNRCFVAGVQYHEGCAWLHHMRAGEALDVRHEPENPHDQHAVALWHPRFGVRLGYVPRRENRHLSRLLAQDASLDAFITVVDPAEVTWRAVEVSVGVAG